MFVHTFAKKRRLQKEQSFAKQIDLFAKQMGKPTRFMNEELRHRIVLCVCVTFLFFGDIFFLRCLIGVEVLVE